MRFKIDKNTIWESTDKIILHNYPPSPRTFSYITRVYREYKMDSVGYKEVEGEPIYLNDMTYEQRALAIIMGTAQNVLLGLLKHSKELTEIKE